MGFFDFIKSGASALGSAVGSIGGGFLDIAQRTAGQVLSQVPQVAAQVLINKALEKVNRGAQTGRVPVNIGLGAGGFPTVLATGPGGFAGPVAVSPIATPPVVSVPRFNVGPVGPVAIPSAQPVAVAGPTEMVGGELGRGFDLLGAGFCTLFPKSPFCGPSTEASSMAVLPGGVVPQLGAGGGGISGLISQSPFTVGPSGGLRPRRILQFTHPITGRIVWYRNMGRPILWSGDLSSTARTNRVAARAKRTRRATRVRRRR